MITEIMDTVIHYRHDPNEIAALEAAIIPMADAIAAVCKPDERHKLKLLTKGDFFRLRDAEKVKSMLIRACKYARASLGEYFPAMRQEVLVNAQRLEDSVNCYWSSFQSYRLDTEVTH